METQTIASYDINQTYEWNYANAPALPSEIDIPTCKGNWDFCGIPVRSPLGMPAGPLLNSRWILHYAGLGFDVLTYKTVRSSARACYPLPNLLPVGPLTWKGADLAVVASPNAADSWAISFGMPSRDPATWRDDVEVARRGLGTGQVLVVSVVASPQENWTMDRIAADFAQCARWASDSGAQAIGANLSCPNVCTQEASLYTSPEASGLIAAGIREAVPALPIILKVGSFDNREQAAGFVKAVRGFVTAVSTTNGISAVVTSAEGSPLFDGARRGIGGAAIRGRCVTELQMLRELDPDLRLIGVGGVSPAADVRERLAYGAHHVQIATAAMLDPLLGISIRQEQL